MTRRRLLPTGLVLTLILLGAASPGRVAEQWIDEEFKRKEFQKLIVVGISEDLQARKNFENKFVSHLRGRGIGGVTSYSLVPDLMEAQDEEPIVREIHAQGIDGAITVRVVPLTKERGEAEWAAAWAAAAGEDDDLRELIDLSLPVSETKAGRFGVEVALWETESWDRVWAGRTNAASRKQLRKKSGTFVESVMTVLTNRELL